jgi:hypothetical protein
MLRGSYYKSISTERDALMKRITNRIIIRSSEGSRDDDRSSMWDSSTSRALIGMISEQVSRCIRSSVDYVRITPGCRHSSLTLIIIVRRFGEARAMRKKRSPKSVFEKVQLNQQVCSCRRWLTM